VEVKLIKPDKLSPQFFYEFSGVNGWALRVLSVEIRCRSGLLSNAMPRQGAKWKGVEVLNLLNRAAEDALA
jgi:hypothetical protein